MKELFKLEDKLFGIIEYKYCYLILLVIVFGGCYAGGLYSYLSRVEDRVLFSVDSFTLSKQSQISIGEDSDIAFSAIPHKYMTVDYVDEDNPYYSFRIHTEDCYYYKVNGETINLFDVKPGSVIRAGGDSLTYKELVDLVDLQENKYYMVRNLFAKKNPLFERNPVYKEIHSVFTVNRDRFWKHVESIAIILIDHKTDLFVEGEKKPMITTKTTRELEGNGKGRANEFKLQFFTMKEIEITSNKDKPDNDQFHIDNKILYASPKQVFTAWGAGHVILRPEKREIPSTRVSFPRSIMLSENADSVKAYIKRGGGQIGIKQLRGFYPTENDLYLPHFSSFLPANLSDLRISGEDKIEMHAYLEKAIREQEKDPEKKDHIEKKRVLEEGGSFMPSFYKDEIKLSSGAVQSRMRIFNGDYLLSFHWVLLVLFVLLGSALFFIPRIREDIAHVNSNNFRSVGWYYLGIYSVLFTFLNYKLIIAQKLAYSYPFFEKMIFVAYGSTMLIMILFPLVIWTIGFRSINTTIRGQKISIPAVLFFVLVAVLAGLGFLFYHRGIGDLFFQHIASSYHASEMSLNPLSGVVANVDNHLNVLLWLLAAVVGLLLLFVIKWGYAKKKKEWKWMSKIYVFLQEIPQRWEVLLPVYLFLCAVFFLLNANYASAIITAVGILLFVSGMRFLESRVSWKMPFLSGLSLCCLIIIPAIFHDFGYFTTGVGFLLTLLILYLLEDRHASERMRGRFVLQLGLVLVILIPAILGIYKWSHDPDAVEYGRKERRIENTFRMDQVRETGYRYNESDMEFMAVIAHYTENKNKGDVYGPEHFIHPSVSFGQSPVALNDLSALVGFFGPLGIGRWGLLLLCLLVMVFLSTVCPFLRNRSLSETAESGFRQAISPPLMYRLLAVLIWVGTSMYIYISYLGGVPFTGRLIYGLGVDSLGEAFEIVVLFSFMCVFTFWNENKPTLNKSEDEEESF